MNKIYVIGSISNINKIEAVSNTLRSSSENIVRSVRKEPMKLKDCIIKCFKNIDWCDYLYVVTKDNGSVGDGVTYELVYAELKGKKIYMV